jgi:hypothetical protein
MMGRFRSNQGLQASVHPVVRWKLPFSEALTFRAVCLDCRRTWPAMLAAGQVGVYVPGHCPDRPDIVHLGRRDLGLVR